MSALFDYWHKDRRFGMFIHWGIYSLLEKHEQIQDIEQIPRAEYEKLAARFDPQQYDPEAWVRLAKRNGMKYICFTTKHHDGFCMWDTKQTDYNIMHTPYGKDVLRMLADACAKEDIALCLYYSNPDWHHPNAYNSLSTHQMLPSAGDEPCMEKYIEYIKAQITELLTGYGKIWGLFWDIPPHIQEPSINALARNLQPGIMINDRGFDTGDFSTPERFVPDGKAFSSPTEACESVEKYAWGYRSHETLFSTHTMTSRIDKIMAMGGNYLLNIGPKPDGTLPENSVKKFDAIGNWYLRVREGLEQTEPCSELFSDREDLLVTRRGNTIYLHFPVDPECTGVSLDPIATLPERAVLLNNSQILSTALRILPRRRETAVLHLEDLPVDTLTGETYVVRLDFTDLDAVIDQYRKTKEEDARK